MNNSDLTKILSMLSKMDKEDLAKGMAQAEKLLKNKNNSEEK